MGDAAICERGGRGLIFPLVDAEHDLPDGLRAPLYGAALVYLFLGVNIVSDKFMSAIERITEQTREVERGGRTVTVKVWNDTVANLTLLALGSSAPEIMLSVMEVFLNEFSAGVLGPSTILGSAAFNLFVIIAVCVVVVPSAEVRAVENVRVLWVTAAFSLFAYLWLLLIVQVVSPGVVSVVEGLLTLALMPVLVLVSWLTDIGWEPCPRRRASVAALPEEAQAAATAGAAVQPAVAAPACAAAPAAKPAALAASAAERCGAGAAEGGGRSGDSEVRLTCQQVWADADAGAAPGGSSGSLLSSRAGGCSAWRQEILDAVLDVAGGGEDDSDGGGHRDADAQGPSPLDWAFHVLSVPWRLAFAVVVPPPQFADGWLCFVMSLFGLGGLTAFIIDFAELLGCVTDISDYVTAITVVALGTSMPDLFASRTAAVKEETADASVVNVTGSNSVNVFLGIGLPWSIAALYWRAKGQEFEVPAGDLAFGVVVFTVAAVVALALLAVRRRLCGGELGGPYVGKMLSGLLLVLLYVFYVALSIWKVMAGDVGLGQQALAVAGGLFVLENVMLVLGSAALLVRRARLPAAPQGGVGAAPLVAVSAEVIGNVAQPASPEAQDLAVLLHRDCLDEALGVSPTRAQSRVNLTTASMVLLAAVRLRRNASLQRRQRQQAQAPQPAQSPEQPAAAAEEPELWPALEEPPRPLTFYGAVLTCLACRRFAQQLKKGKHAASPTKQLPPVRPPRGTLSRSPSDEALRATGAPPRPTLVGLRHDLGTDSVGSPCAPLEVPTPSTSASALGACLPRESGAREAAAPSSTPRRLSIDTKPPDNEAGNGFMTGAHADARKLSRDTKAGVPPDAEAEGSVLSEEDAKNESRSCSSLEGEPEEDEPLS